MPERIEEIIAELSAPPTKDQAASGWAEKSKEGLLLFFECLLDDVKAGRSIGHIGTLRSLDTWGISGGFLYDKIIEVSAELNASRRG